VGCLSLGGTKCIDRSLGVGQQHPRLPSFGHLYTRVFCSGRRLGVGGKEEDRRRRHMVAASRTCMIHTGTELDVCVLPLAWRIGIASLGLVVVVCGLIAMTRGISHEVVRVLRTSLPQVSAVDNTIAASLPEKTTTTSVVGSTYRTREVHRVPYNLCPLGHYRRLQIDAVRKDYYSSVL
jgi:hypothetical protein